MSAACGCTCWTATSKATARRTRVDQPSVRRRYPHPHPPRVGARRRRRAALAALGITPGAYHLNEGHSAFGALEVVRQRMHDDGMSFEEAARQSARMSCFTTHTPVPAGHDRFPADPDRRAPRAAARFDGDLARSTDGLGRVDPRTQRAVLHDRAGA
jgi:hypothetical protein